MTRAKYAYLSVLPQLLRTLVKKPRFQTRASLSNILTMVGFKRRGFNFPFSVKLFLRLLILSVRKPPKRGNMHFKLDSGAIVEREKIALSQM